VPVPLISFNASEYCRPGTKGRRGERRTGETKSVRRIEGKGEEKKRERKEKLLIFCTLILLLPPRGRTKEGGGGGGTWEGRGFFLA